jgi:hypothetical protein
MVILHFFIVRNFEGVSNELQASYNGFVGGNEYIGDSRM